ncbi:MAG: helix-turn-helix domain-containing protein [Candidatus Omnitrophica bacterium]|nr:helix-turn-helix domain-containing protein [Candidatus Omnitrophota bacterium]
MEIKRDEIPEKNAGPSPEEHTEMDYGLFLAFNRGEVYDKVITGTERKLLVNALKASFGNQSIAAKLLGINRNTLHSKVKKLGIDVSGFKI